MKPDELNLTIEELDRLCHLYMDCRLTVLEEKELEYTLTHTTLTSPVIAEVRSLMSISTTTRPAILPRRRKMPDWRYIMGVAASVAVIISVAVYLHTYHTPSLSDGEPGEYIAAYSHGKRLNEVEAVKATDKAMAKADSLMNYAALVEHEYIIKAEDIITETFNN